jgi:hypothetical protein
MDRLIIGVKHWVPKKKQRCHPWESITFEEMAKKEEPLRLEIHGTSLTRLWYLKPESDFHLIAIGKRVFITNLLVQTSAIQRISQTTFRF